MGCGVTCGCPYLTEELYKLNPMMNLHYHLQKGNIQLVDLDCQAYQFSEYCLYKERSMRVNSKEGTDNTLNMFGNSSHNQKPLANSKRKK